MKLGVIILAGGKSSRMGEDKGLMLFNGKPMIQYIIELAKPFSDHIIIIANNSAYQQFGFPVYADLIKDKGPLVGVYTGLMHSENAKNIVLSCDVPFVNESLIKLLIAESANIDVVIPEKENRTHQLIGIYDKACCTTFKNELDKNELKIKLAIKKLNYKIVDANHISKKTFKNLNSKNDITA